MSAYRLSTLTEIKLICKAAFGTVKQNAKRGDDLSKEEIRKYLASIGSKGGKVGGKAKTPKKLEALKKSLEKARKKRWPKRKKIKET